VPVIADIFSSFYQRDTIHGKADPMVNFQKKIEEDQRHDHHHDERKRQSMPQPFGFERLDLVKVGYQFVDGIKHIFYIIN
jgi:hypothetical protein